MANPVTTLTTNRFNWGEELKSAANDISISASAQGGGNSQGPVAIGNHPAFLQEVKHGTFKSGSYGLTFTYVIESGEAKNRKIREYLVLSKADGTTVKFSGQRLKRRLMGFGLPLEKINAFKGPRNEHDLGDFRLVVNAPVTIVVKDDGEYEGRPSRKVAAVYQRTLE